MNLKDLLNELRNCKCFRELDETKNFCAFFMIRDLEKKTDKIQLDYFLPDKKRIAVFEHPFSSAKIPDDKIEGIDEQTTDIIINIEHLEEIIKNSLERNKINISPSKIIAILKENVWNLTVLDNFLSVVRFKINALTGEETPIEKNAIFDFVRVEKIKD